MLHPLAGFLLALPFLLGPGTLHDRAAQDAEQVRIHMKVVRDHRASPEARTAAMDALLALGTEGPRQLATQITKTAKEQRKRNEKDLDRLRTDFERQARRILDGRLDRRGMKEVEELRAKILGLTRSRGLTKEQVVAESDPALERLEALLVVTTDQVFAADANELAARRDGLGAQIAEEILLHEYWYRAHARLEALPDGERIARRLKEPADASSAEEDLARELEHAALLTTPMSEGDRRIFAANAALAAQVAPSEAEGTLLLNLLRVHLGLRALKLDPLLCLAGRDHCQDMVTLGFFSHDSPVEGKETPARRAARAGTSGGAENIAMGQPTAARVIKAWWHSPGHHKNMLGGHGRTGLGRHDDHWAQMFGK